MTRSEPAQERGPSLYLCESDHRDAGAPNLFASLTLEESGRLRAVSTLLQFRAGEDVFQQGERHEGMFVILAGEVRSYYASPSGREITLAYWAPGNFVGGPEIFGGGPHMWSGRAMRPTQVLHVRGTELRRLMREIPNLAIALVEALEHKGKCYSAMIHMLGTRSASERLAQLLVLMADRDGRRCKEGVVVSRTLTHEDLAKMVGATRQWVTTTLERLCAQGMIDVRPAQFIVRDEQRLRRFAGCGDGDASENRRHTP
ncbi:MAG: Crp/Fnr family transcriptional regulator [Methylocella sp.]